MSFVNLHAHSHYSLLDGYGSPKDMVKRCKELGYPAVALTDHGVTYGLVELFKAAKAEGIKPILGCELYVARRTRFDKDPKLDNKPYHLTVLAKNNQGYENLLKMVTEAHLEGFYYKPRVDYDLLKKNKEGLIVLSGCISAHIPRTILSGDENESKALIQEYIDTFGKDNFYLEVQDHPLFENQQIVNKKLKEYAKHFDLKLVATNDSHYPCAEDSDIHDIMVCIQTGTNVMDENRMKYTGDFSLRPVDELREVFKDFPGAIDNALEIADKCEIDFDFTTNLIPSYDTPNGEKADAYLKTLCSEGLKNRFINSEVPKEYTERLDYELDVVHKMGFDTYFLIVQDFVNFAREKGIVVGPGRGSAAGSIISWTLKITNVDPLKYGLFFERFLNPERVSMPDIDIDFADHRRDEVINYVVEKYGRDNVAQIITFGTMAPRAAVRDVGRALGYPYQEVDQLAKMVPPPILGKHTPLDVSIKDDPTLSSEYDKNPRAKALLDYARRLEGSVRHIGTHACAVVISEKPLTKYTALQHSARSSEEIVTQYSAKPLEDLGLLKMDFLGLRNLTVIENTLAILKRTKDIDVDMDTIPLDDDFVYEKIFQKADTTGVFQFESGGIRRYLKDLKPTKFDDVVAMGALYRPGPMEWIPTYIEGKHNPESVVYLDESFKDILENTYGVAVFQEQILQLARDFAGFSLGEADILRKAVGKKIPKLLAEQRIKFVEGAVANGSKKKFAEEVFQKVVEPFAGYGFNKAHAVCYGLIAYQTAYLKAHYPIEFMAALLKSDATNMDRVVIEIKECLEMGIDILPPSINESFSNFTVVNENQIRFGLMAIKGIGEGPIQALISERKENGKFKSLEDLAKRIEPKILNKKVIQSLAYGGALDDFGERNQIAESYEEISSYSKFTSQNSSSAQTDIFGMMDDDDFEDVDLKLKSVPRFTNMHKLKLEKEVIGMYVSGHPFKGLTEYISRKTGLISRLRNSHVDRKVKALGIVSEFRKILTKTGKYMATFVLEDSSARINCIIFPHAFGKIGDSVSEDSILMINGKFNFRRDEYQLICESIKPLSLNAMIENAKESNIFDMQDKGATVIRNIEDIIAEEKENEGMEESNETSEKKSSVHENSENLIQIPKGTDSEKMKELKQILLSNKGDSQVELFLEASNKRIKLPFGVNYDDELRKQISSLLV